MATSTAPETLTRDQPCAGCDYNLRGLFVDGTCPECGLKVGVTLASVAGFGQPWVQKFVAGLGWMRITLAVGLPTLVVPAVALQAASPRAEGLMLASVVVTYSTMMLFASSARLAVAAPWHREARLLRWRRVLIAALLCCAFMPVAVCAAGQGGGRAAAADWILAAFAILAPAVLVFCVWRHIRQVLQLLHQQDLAASAAVVSWLAVGAVLPVSASFIKATTSLRQVAVPGAAVVALLGVAAACYAGAAWLGWSLIRQVSVLETQAQAVRRRRQLSDAQWDNAMATLAGSAGPALLNGPAQGQDDRPGQG